MLITFVALKKDTRFVEMTTKPRNAHNGKNQRSNMTRIFALFLLRSFQFWSLFSFLLSRLYVLFFFLSLSFTFFQLLSFTLSFFFSLFCFVLCSYLSFFLSLYLFMSFYFLLFSLSSLIFPFLLIRLKYWFFLLFRRSPLFCKKKKLCSHICFFVQHFCSIFMFINYEILFLCASSQLQKSLNFFKGGRKLNFKVFLRDRLIKML